MTTRTDPGGLTGFQQAVAAAQSDARESQANGVRERVRKRFRNVNHNLDDVPVLAAMDLLDLVSGRLPDRLTKAGSDGTLCIVPIKDRRDPWFVSSRGHAALKSHTVADVGGTAWNAWSTTDTDEERLWQLL